MLRLPVKISQKNPRVFRAEFNAVTFERLAANLGLFNPAFLKSVDRAEADVRAGRVWEIKKFSDLRRKSR